MSRFRLDAVTSFVPAILLSRPCLSQSAVILLTDIKGAVQRDHLAASWSQLFSWLGRIQLTNSIGSGWEKTYTVQSMYFVKGQRVDPNAAFVHTPGDTPQNIEAGFHNYAIELNKDSVKWYIDDWLTRTLPKLDGVPFPSGASRARMGVWDGSQTSGWAGTVDWNQGPFTAEMQWFKFTPYC
ncbi:hypothetical protein GGI13_002841 [Coemansia sp. RSA 455]|nr:hypothetical protein GGI13_002841 [Coemansia sp. RSA 455]